MRGIFVLGAILATVLTVVVFVIAADETEDDRVDAERVLAEIFRERSVSATDIRCEPLFSDTWVCEFDTTRLNNCDVRIEVSERELTEFCDEFRERRAPARP